MKDILKILLIPIVGLLIYKLNIFTYDHIHKSYIEKYVKKECLIKEE